MRYRVNIGGGYTGILKEIAMLALNIKFKGSRERGGNISVSMCANSLETCSVETSSIDARLCRDYMSAKIEVVCIIYIIIIILLRKLG
jgi:hypothetical protein